MIIGKIHPGSGLGDQLFSYITTRTIALDCGYDFGFVGKEFFKGKDFMQLDWGKDIPMKYHIEQPSGELITETLTYPIWKADKPYYDPEVNFIEDGTIIDGCYAQDERYWGHKLSEIREWLKTNKFPKNEKNGFGDNICIINFRGGEFRVTPELFLQGDYWETVMKVMVDKYPNILFQVHTDDKETAREMFGEKAIIFSNIEINWLAVRYAKHLILSNSAFGILPALLNENVKEVLAPRYWARRNIKQWSMPSNYYKKFSYI